jgi:hypothetical protein
MNPPSDLAEVMIPVTGFVQREPEDGQPASQKTDVYMGYDSQYVYVIFVAFDEEPEKIRAHISRRENVHSDETVEIQLDTFEDERRAFSFLTNPFGIQWDAIWTEGQGFDMSWDTVWHSRGELTERGYVVWMAIPFKSLRFPPPADGENQSWGVIFVRDIPRNNETSFWPQVTSRVEGRLNQAATATGFGNVPPGRNIWLIPYFAATQSELQPDPSEPANEFDRAQVGLDAKWVIQDKLALDLTANPNFAQVESDEPQVTVNRRFEVFFPEKRPFFLENADYFRTPINLLFTRRIRDPEFGARLTGQVGKYEIGTLIMDDEAPGKVVASDHPLSGESALNGIFRVSRDLPRQSNVGFMFTARELQDSRNRVGGFDSRIKFDDNWDTRLQAVFSSTRVVDPETTEVEDLSDPAYDIVFNRNGRKINTHIHYQDIGEEFFTTLGFVPRSDIRDTHANFNYNFWPERKALIRWTPNIRVLRITNHDGIRLDESIAGNIEFELRRRTNFGVFADTGSERLLKCRDYFDDSCDPDTPDPVQPLADDIDFDVGEVGFFFGTQFMTAVNFDLEFETEKTVNFSPVAGEAPAAADEKSGEVGLTLRLGRRIRIETDYLYTQLDDRESNDEILTNQIVRTRFDWQFNPKLSLRTILQYDKTDPNPALTGQNPRDRLNADLLLTYLVNPWTAFYIGYNSNESKIGIDVDGNRFPVDDRFNNANGVFVKVSYLFRP